MARHSCIICANGNDLPEGEYCRACGRKAALSGGQVIAPEKNALRCEPEPSSSPASLIAKGEGMRTMTTSQSESNTGEQAGSK